MNSPTNRRNFIRQASLTGISLAMTNSMAFPFISPDESVQIKNDYFIVSFDTRNGIIRINRHDGSEFVSGAVSAINTNSGKTTSASSGYKLNYKSISVKNELGQGQMLIIYCKDLNQKADLEIQISVYQNLQAVVIESLCKNSSRSEKLNLKSIEPLRSIKQECGSLLLSNISKCLSNGAIYYDAGDIHTFGTPFLKKEPYGETKGGVAENTSLSNNSETVKSWWNAGLFNANNKDGITMGYIENKMSLGQVFVSKNSENEISFVAESVFLPGLFLLPGQVISSDRFMIYAAENPYASLEGYAAIFGKINKARTKSIVNGWCNWFYTLDKVNEDEIIKNSEFISTHLKQYGMEYIQVDEGFQKCHGEWEGNDRFPHGMKWLAGKIKELGLKPGLWVAPYVVSESAEIFKNNPEWFLKNPDGSQKRVGPWPNEETDWAKNENPKRYGLDITHPGAAKWFYNLFDTIVNNWGYEMIKIDFVAWSVLSAHHYYDTSNTPAQVYRKGAEMMRKAAGNNSHILECGPGQVTCGLIDSMRIEYDQYYGFAKDAWKQYFVGPSCSASASAKRYYFHSQTWINDADHICLDLVSNQQAQSIATIIGLSGGNLMSGDRLTSLDATKLEILKKVFPAYGQNARPVNLFDTDIQTAFAIKVKKEFSEWTVAGFFNSDMANTSLVKFPIERIGLQTGKTFLAYDFWNNRFVGEIKNEIEISILPGSVTLFSLHEKTGNPQFISTDRHILQGAIEVENVSFNKETKIINGISKGPLGSNHNIKIYIPSPSYWKNKGIGLFYDDENFSLKMVDDNILSINVRFKETTRVEWSALIES